MLLESLTIPSLTIPSIICTFLCHLQVLPIVIYFSSVVSILYYLGVMQFVILRIAKLMQLTMGTSAGESLNAAGNIFIGQVRWSSFIPIFMKFKDLEAKKKRFI